MNNLANQIKAAMPKASFAKSIVSVSLRWRYKFDGERPYGTLVILTDRTLTPDGGHGFHGVDGIDMEAILAAAKAALIDQGSIGLIDEVIVRGDESKSL